MMTNSAIFNLRGTASATLERASLVRVQEVWDLANQHRGAYGGN